MTEHVPEIDRNAEALQLAIKAAEAKTGLRGNSALAKALEVTPQAISQWTQIPLGRVFDVETALGIPRGKLRPDFFEKARAQ